MALPSPVVFVRARDRGISFLISHQGAWEEPWASEEI